MAQHPASGGYEYPQQEARFLQLQPAPQTTTMSDMMVDIFLEQGILGVMLLILGGYFYKTESLARTDRINLQNKLETLVERSQDNLVEVKTIWPALTPGCQFREGNGRNEGLYIH